MVLFYCLSPFACCTKIPSVKQLPFQITGYTTLPTIYCYCPCCKYGPSNPFTHAYLSRKRKFDFWEVKLQTAKSRYFTFHHGVTSSVRRLCTVTLIVSIKGQWAARLRYTACLLQCLLGDGLLLCAVLQIATNS